MADSRKLERVPIGSLVPYGRNAKKHPVKQIDLLKKSISEFGFISPVLIDKDFNILAGHGRVMAAKELGLKEIPAVFVEGLTDTQRRAYILADNRLTELGGWDRGLVLDELNALQLEEFNIELTGFDVPGSGDWFEDRDRWTDGKQAGNDEYNSFVEKFEEKHTTDDCYTPDNIYDVVASYVEKTYGLDRKNFVRPFYPGGDYEHEKYPAGCVVVDNPPFSIFSEILKFYNEHGIRYFLFSNALTVISGAFPRAAIIALNFTITYENGAKVSTSFVTNLEDVCIRSDPLFYDLLKAADEENNPAANLPKYDYPENVATATQFGYMSKNGVAFKIPGSEAQKISILDAQKAAGTPTIFGCGILVSDHAAARKTGALWAASENAASKRAAEDKASAEKVGVTIWQLSDRERAIVETLENGRK